MKLVGLCGYAQVGKDIAAVPFIAAGWKRAAFADLLKEDLRSLLETAYRDLPAAATAGYSLPEFNDTRTKSRLRPLMVEYGRTMRALYPSIWIDRLFHRLTPGERYVITDVRYANEAARIRETGGVVVQIVRPGVSWANNEELRSMGEFTADLTIVNDGTVEDLHTRMKQSGLI